MMTQRQLFLNHIAQTSAMPLLLEIQKGEGVYLIDKEDNKYIDLISGISVSNLGHCHPEVVEAVRRQAGEFMHTMVYGEFVMSPQVGLARLMAEQLPECLGNIYFVNSGAEAVEGAMKLAKRYTGRYEIIACRNAYHGSTQGTASLMSEDYFTRAFRPLLPGIRHIDYNCEWCLEQITEKTAAVVMETVQAEWGVRTPATGYLDRLRRRCDEVGALLIFDEIQVGFGRTGSLFAFEQYGIIPDIITFAKGMGGGMPIGAFASSKSIMRTLTHDPVLGHITTFGGHPVCCAAALASLQVLLREPYIQQVKQKADLFKELLVHPLIQDVRNAGLIMAVEIGDFDKVNAVIQKALKKGVIVDWFLFNDRSIRIAPPLIITEDEIRHACQVLLDSMDEVLSEAG